MRILTYPEINNILENFLADIKSFNPYMYAIFHTMYLTGARFQDVYNFNNWRKINDITVSLQPKKNNNLRVFNDYEIDEFMFQAIQQNFDFSRQISYSNCIIWYKRFIKESNIMVKSKSVATHLFRHNKAKELKNSGMTDEEIRIYFGQTNVNSTRSYIYSQVYIA